MSDELQDEMIEETPTKRGRPNGSRDKSTSRRAVRNRVALHRQRKREQAEAEEERQAEYEKLLKYQKEQNLVFFGEISPGQNAQTPQEELEVASDFATAMSMEPIKVGETIRAFLNRVLRHWCEIGTPLLSREIKIFGERVQPADSKRFDDVAEIEKYEFPNGCDVPYQAEETVINA